MSLNRKVLLVFIVSIVLILLLNNGTYYFSTKSLLISNLKDHDKAIAKQVSNSIEQSLAGSQYLMDLIGSDLRTAALFIKERLDPDINHVTNEELIKLRDEIGLITGITLFEKRADGDIVGVRSTVERERDLHTKSWGTWFKAFNQLFDQKNVTVEKGIPLSNFWVGPFEVSTSDPKHIGTWGYYYDGTSNYIIDPWVLDESINQYDEITGPKTLFEHTVGKDGILEITIFNPANVGHEVANGVNANNERWVALVGRQIMYGNYTYQYDTDFDNVHAAMDSGKVVTSEATVNGKHVIKTFVPIVDVKIPYVVSTVSDYSVIQTKLNGEFKLLALVIFIVSIIVFGLIYVAIRYIGRIRDDAVRATQEPYIEQINAMFTTIRGQRHDFLNHISTLHALLHLEKFDELRSYSKEFINDIQEVSEIIQIGNPAVAALIQSKLTIAVSNKINLTYKFEGFNELSTGIKTIDIVNIIANLIDNAFEEVDKFTEIEHIDRRWVSVSGEIEYGILSIHVSNPLSSDISAEEFAEYFKPDLSTKSKESHSGLGLAILKNIINKYKGQITYHIEDSIINFKITLPIEKKRKEAS